jgi:predicted PurR-regulated permease PerM
MSEIDTALPPDYGLVPGWLQRLAAIGWRLLAAVALLLVVIWIATLLSTVTASVLVAAIVAATFAPFVLALRDRGWSRIKAAAAVFLGAAAVIVATLAVIAVAFLPYAKDVVTDLTTGLGALKNLLAQYSFPPEVGDTVDHVTTGVQAWLSASASELASSIGTVFTIGLLATFLTFFFLMDGDKAWVWAMASANDWRRGAISSAGHVALQRVGGYLRGTAVIAAFDGIAEGLFLVVLGVPHALPLAVIVFFGRFIPYIGGLVTTILLLLVTLATAGTTAALILLILIAILDVIQGKFLAPAIYNKTVHIHPAVVLTALPAGAALAGAVGLFVAIPVVAFALAITGALIEVLGVEPTARSTTSPLVPVWLDRLGQWSWRLLVALALLGVGIAAATQVPIVVLPLVLGIVLASTLLPLLRRLEARGWAKGRAALVATVGATLGVAVIVSLTIVSLAGPASDLISTGSAGASSSSDALGGNGGALVALVDDFGVGVLKTIAGVLSSLAGLGVVVFLAILLTFYFLRDGDAFWAAFLRRVEPWRQSYVDAAGTRAVNVLGGYMLGTGAISLFGAATQFLIMTILGLPLALPLAVLAFFGGFIPYIGSLLTTGLAFLVTVATGSPQDILIMAIFTIVFNIVQGNIVAPIVYSRVVSLHPAVVLVAIPAGNAVAGVIGMFLVVPFLGVVATVWRTVLLVLDSEPIATAEEVPALIVAGDEAHPASAATIATP